MIARIITFVFLSLIPAICQPTQVIIPSPQKTTTSSGAAFRLTKSTKIFFQTREVPRKIETSLRPMADVLASELELVTGVKPTTAKFTRTQEIPKGSIVLRFSELEAPFAQDEAAEEQPYTLRASDKGIVITSPYSKGVSYGTASLIQALQETPAGFMLPKMHIDDAPAAEYRALMLDVARQPHSIAVIKDTIRLARLYKLRYLQLHLTDDQLFTYPFEPITSKLTNNHVYSREALLDLVSYADARGVTIIPELDLPGHSSRLMQSGYLDPGKNHADVADPANFKKVTTLVDDMLTVFKSSPYFHIGGDESGAGGKLVPFLQHINTHLRSKPEGEKRRMLVWEGFHGSPTRELPAKGEDRIIVMAWESSYNAPWNLLKSGYQIINASWKPTYVCGGGASTHPGNTSGRRFQLKDIYRWKPTIFMHWEPGRPVYEDRGPKDPKKDDGEWDASVMKRDKQILGGQMLYWEQAEKVVINSLYQRVATISQRLWNPDKSLSYADFSNNLNPVSDRVLTIVQPIQILPATDPTQGPITDFYNHYDTKSLEISFKNRTKIDGEVRYLEGGFKNNVGFFGFPDTPHPTSSSPTAKSPVTKSGGFSICAKLFRKDGSQIDGTSWAFYNNWPMRVSVTEFEMGRHTKPKVADLANLPESRILRKHQLPMLRGPLRNVTIRAQMIESTLTAPGTGTYEIGMKTQNGTASLYLDVNQNDKWDKVEKLIANTPTSEKRILVNVELKKGQKYRLRVDHNNGIPRPVLIVSLEGPGTNGSKDITSYLSLE